MSTRQLSLRAWRESLRGRELAAMEAELLRGACDDVFGLEFLQLGAWGGQCLLPESGRTRHRTLATELGDDVPVAGLRCRLTQLPFANGAIDAVLLPHSLETHSAPHDLLREADRVLRGEGQLLVLGFAPLRPWSLRRPAGLRRLLGASRVRDWLALLGYEIADTQRYLHCGPYAASARALARRGGDDWSALAPWPASAWLLKARKRVYGVLPPRVRRRELHQLVGVAKPSARGGAEAA